MTIADQLPIPVVRVSPTSSAFTTSTDMAAFFDKRHSHVLQAIEGLLSDLREHIHLEGNADVEDQRSAFNVMEDRLRQPYVAPLAEDLAFAKGLRVKDKLMLHEQAYKASRALSVATNEHEHRQAYWQLYQVNTPLGPPMPTMAALDVRHLSPGSTEAR